MFLHDSDEPTSYALCGELGLQEGILVSHNFSTPVQYVLGAQFQQTCFEGDIPMLNTNVDLILNEFSEPLPIVKQSWEEYTLQSGTFVNGLVPVLYSISFLAVVTWFLTIFVLTTLRKSSIFLQGSTAFALIYMIILVVKSLIVLHGQQRLGYFNGPDLMNQIANTNWINAIDLVVILLLQVNQVQVIMRLFSRQSDKRLIFLAGVSLAIGSQVLWSVMKFHPFPESKEAERIIPALTYLVRIATNIIYATIFTAFLLIKIKTVLANRSIWLITFISFIFIYAPVAFFIAEVTSPWAHEFSVVTYVVCVVLPWEWCNKYHMIQKIQEKEGVLGRKFYEDEMFELDRLGLFVEEEEDEDEEEDHDDDDSHNNNSLTDNEESFDTELGSTDLEVSNSKQEPSSSSISRQLTQGTGASFSRLAHIASNSRDHAVQRTNSHVAFASMTHGKLQSKGPSARSKIYKGYLSFRDSFLNATDKVIAIGFEIPRPGSKSSSRKQTPNFQFERESIFEDEIHKSVFKRPPQEPGSSRPANSNATRANRDVFLYSTKNVVISPEE